MAYLVTERPIKPLPSTKMLAAMQEASDLIRELEFRAQGGDVPFTELDCAYGRLFFARPGSQVRMVLEDSIGVRMVHQLTGAMRVEIAEALREFIS